MSYYFIILLSLISFNLFSQDYSDSLLIVKNNKIWRFSTKTVEINLLNELNSKRNSNLKNDTTMYKNVKKHSLYMLKVDKCQHSDLKMDYIEFIGHNKIKTNLKIKHKELAIGILNGFLQTELHKLVLIDTKIKKISVAVSSNLLKQNEDYYYNIYTTIHIEQ
jgi:hypothetical protein